MTRFAIVGNCQAVYVAHCVRCLAPGSEVDAHVVFETSRRTEELQKLAEQLAGYDYVLAQSQFCDDASPLRTLDGEARRLVRYPSVLFTAFHPDLVYIMHTPTGTVAKSPLVDYHSALVFLCYSLGLTPEQTVERFNERVFTRLGYFAKSHWTSSERSLLNAGRAAGLPLERSFRSWVRRGCFMYSVNHPKLFVLADITAAALASCGVPTVDPRLCEYYLPDEIQLGAIWPVYPEIASKFGILGSYCFKAVASAEHISRYYQLGEFVEESFASYRKHKLTDLLCTRVEAWKADSDLLQCVLGDVVPVPPADPPEAGIALSSRPGPSRGLPCDASGTLCIVDSINSLPAAAAQQICVSAGDATIFNGWAVDVHSGSPAAGVDVVIDGVAYQAEYANPRPDVAKAKGPAFENSGFQFWLPPGVLGRGSHSFTIRVIAADRHAYYEGPSGHLLVE